MLRSMAATNLCTPAAITNPATREPTCRHPSAEKPEHGDMPRAVPVGASRVDESGE